MILFCCRRWVLLGLLLLAWCPSAHGEGLIGVTTPAAVCATCAPVVLADGFSVSKLFAGLNTRTRIVQAGAVFMCIALFIIIMRKLN
jgi:hypothetical protein